MCPENGGVEMKVEVCEKGHVQCFYVPARKRRGGRCPACASATMADCPACGAPIGRRVGCEIVAFVWRQDLRVPRHCARCGRDLPWEARRGRGGALAEARAWARRHLVFRATRAALAASGLMAGLASATCALAGRAHGPATDMEAAGDGSYRITVRTSRVRASMELVGSGWICDCPGFEGGAARCGHVWTAVLLGMARPLACRLGLPREIRGPAGKKTGTAAAMEQALGDAVLDPARFEEAALARINSAWEAYLEWERFANRDMELSVGMAEDDPGRAMHHAQQAMEKQIKALMVYCAAFDGKFSTRKLRHDIFMDEHDKDFKTLLNNFGLELKELTMGIRNERSKSRIMGYIGTTPSLVAYGIDIDEESAPLEMEKLTLERHYRYLQASLSPPRHRPHELECPTREYVSCSEQARLDYGRGVETVARQWDIDSVKIMNEFASGAWKWRHYALYVHEDARYPSEFDPAYSQNADIVRGWVFEAGRMTAHLQSQARWYYATHTHKGGNRLRRHMGTVRDVSWYENQLERDWQQATGVGRAAGRPQHGTAGE